MSNRGGTYSDEQGQRQIKGSEIPEDAHKLDAEPFILLSLVNRLPVQNGLQHFGFVDLLHGDFQNVLIYYDEVGRLPGFDGAGHVFLFHKNSAIAGENLDCGFSIEVAGL